MDIEVTNLVAAIIGGGVTVFALERFTNWLRRPILVLSAHDDGCLTLTPYVHQQSKKRLKAKFVRVSVTNRGKGLARGCRCFLLSGKRSDQKGVHDAFIDDPIDLCWARRSEFETAIPGGLHRYFDLCRTLSDPSSVEPPEKQLKVWTNYLPLRLEEFFGPTGEYELQIAVVAENTRLEKLTVRFQYDGDWDKISIL